MITAHGLELFNQKSKEESPLAIDGYLFKPVTADMLAEAVYDAKEARSGKSRRQQSLSAPGRLAGLRILVVEDNRLNQQIARELLELNGAQVEVAENGLEGVRRALATVPSAILMDMQMPDIDGLEATRRIRQSAHMQSVPIIAMTANAMESDRQACLEAGMVDHVAKPIDLDLLIKTIQKHTVADFIAEPAAEEKAEPSLPAAPERLVDVELAVSRIGGNREFYGTLVAAVNTDGYALLDELKNYLAQNDLPSAARSLHTFKGLAATLGAQSLSQLAAATELLIRKNDAQTDHALLTRRIAEIETLLQDVMQELSALKRSTPGSDAATATGAPESTVVESAHSAATLRSELAALMDFLRSNNMRSVALCSQLRQEHSSWLTLGQLDLLVEIDRAVSQLNFTNALQLCSQLLELVE